MHLSLLTCDVRYDRTFSFIVKLINEAIAVETGDGEGKNTVIGVLDIYGFEVCVKCSHFALSLSVGVRVCVCLCDLDSLPLIITYRFLR